MNSRTHATPRSALGYAALAVGMATPLIAGLLTSWAPGDGSVLTAVALLVMWVAAGATWICLAHGGGRDVTFRIRLSRGDLLVSAVAGVGGMLLVPALSWLTAHTLGDTQLLESTERAPAWLIVAAVLTAAVTEEILYRAMPMELLLRDRHPSWLVLLAPLALFVLAHLGSWNLAHVVGVVLPMGLLLSALYLWRRNLTVNVLVHLMIDAPLIVIAIMAG